MSSAKIIAVYSELGLALLVIAYYQMSALLGIQSIKPTQADN